MKEDKVTKVVAVLILFLFIGLFVNELKLRRGPVPVIAIVESRDLGIWGNGFFIQDDLVLTAYHLIAGSNMVFIDGQAAQVYWSEPNQDLALLKVRTSKVEPKVKFAKLKPGLRPVRCLTKLHEPEGVQIEIQGNTAAIDVNDVWASSRPVTYLDMTCQPGFSGSPVLDNYDRVVGLVSSSYLRLVICIPIERRKEWQSNYIK